MPDSKTTICFYSDAAEWGGQEILAVRIANAVVGQFSKVLFIYFNKHFKETLNSSIQQIQLPFSASTPFPIIRDRSLKKRKIVQNIFRDYHIQNLVVCPGNIERCLPAVYAANQMGIRTISYYPMAFTQQESGAKLGKIRDVLAKNVYPKISEWIVITQKQEELLRRFVKPHVPIRLLHNPLGWDGILKPRVPKSPLHIATVGRIYFIQKGQDSIPGIALKLCENKVPFTYDILGNGPDSEALQRMIDERGVSDCVQIQNWIPQEELRKKLEQTYSLILMPSHFEGSPMILFEALQSGIPVLVANTEYIREFELPRWMLYDPKDIDSAWQKVRDYPQNYNQDEFIALRERLFKGRDSEGFANRVRHLFRDIFAEDLR